MSPLNRGPPLGSRILPVGGRPLPPPRFGGRPAMPQRIPLPPQMSSPPRMRRMPPMSPMFGPGDPRQRIPPPPLPPQPGSRPGGGGISRLNGVPPLFPGGPRTRGHMGPIVPPMGPRGPLMRPWPRRMGGLPPQMMPPMRPMRYNTGNGSLKGKPIRNAKKINNRAAHLANEETQNQEDENCASSDDEKSHYCEVCDRDFPSNDALSEHKSTHRVCGIDGCTFSAHPMLVEKHINMQHRTGLYERMKDLSIPENLEKWITERKKKYPTEANINLRKAEELEKLQRGEVIKQNSYVQTRTKKTVNVRQKKRRVRKRYPYGNNNCADTDELYRGLRPFPGTRVLQEEDNKTCLDEEVCLDKQTDLCEKITDNISDEDDGPEAPITLKPTNLSANSSSMLPILVADYESEGDDEGPEEEPIKRIKIEKLQDNKITKNAVHEEMSDIQECKKENDKSNNKSGKTIAKFQDKQKHEINRVIDRKNNNFLYRYHNKLLEKLLSRSIQHERNLICQCVKYIIENNFFDLN
ncbi:FMR1-interacting protein NUFIP1 isoform X1 [Anoplolepis gracilipes]|uniref:FMR1-interacting protein NUFIP1 isoform X1 n=1 Tax=Anoplolepis gracilipes TaxID=354296 RepID=UPI003BA2D07E